MFARGRSRSRCPRSPGRGVAAQKGRNRSARPRSDGRTRRKGRTRAAGKRQHQAADRYRPCLERSHPTIHNMLLHSMVQSRLRIENSGKEALSWSCGRVSSLYSRRSVAVGIAVFKCARDRAGRLQKIKLQARNSFFLIDGPSNGVPPVVIQIHDRPTKLACAQTDA